MTLIINRQVNLNKIKYSITNPARTGWWLKNSSTLLTKKGKNFVWGKFKVTLNKSTIRLYKR